MTEVRVSIGVSGGDLKGLTFYTKDIVLPIQPFVGMVLRNLVFYKIQAGLYIDAIAHIREVGYDCVSHILCVRIDNIAISPGELAKDILADRLPGFVMSQ